MVLPTSNRPPLCSMKNPSLHQGIGSRFQSFSSRARHSSTFILSVLMRMLLRRKLSVYFLNVSQSVSLVYRSTNFSLKTYLPASANGFSSIGLFSEGVFERVSAVVGMRTRTIVVYTRPAVC